MGLSRDRHQVGNQVVVEDTKGNQVLALDHKITAYVLVQHHIQNSPFLFSDAPLLLVFALDIRPETVFEQTPVQLNGMSFFTFQQVAYLVDVYKGRAIEPDFLNYCLFITFFPQLISGPNIGGFRMSLLWFGVLGAIATVFLIRTKQGNWTYALGQNKDAARNLGVPVGGMTILLYAVSGFGAALLGLLQAARFDSVDGTRGTGLELYVITVIVVGGTSLFGGYGSALGTMFGAITFSIIQAGLVLSGTPGYFFEGLIGIALFLAVIVNQWFLGNMDRMGGNKRNTIEPAPAASIEDKS